MPRMTQDLLMVGSIPLPTASDVFTTCSDMFGEHLPCVPDGEVGPRLVWVSYLYERFKSLPEVEFQPIPPEMRGDMDVRYNRVAAARGAVHADRADNHLVVSQGVKQVRLKDLGYSAAAIDSYAQFTKLRDEGAVPAHMRFQVAIPFTRGSFGNYFRNPDDYRIMEEAYEEVAKRELAEIIDAIPAKDLAIQWDVCSEILDVDGYWPWWPAGDRDEKIAMNSDLARRLDMDKLPGDAWLGYHICYGTMGGWPMLKPESVASSVALVNALVAKTPRQTDFVHIPAGRKAFDADYFAGLEELDIGDAKLYLGLIHDSEDGLDDFRRRLTAAKAHWSDFGLASVCGYGRCNPEELAHALSVHRDVMADVTKG
ncbi:MAG: hypothetical protein HOF70_02315 [Rhodospirillaceae bacterium]|jgi:hypothetical protein|nr:hypothetical protein [Rhodospirillaceae bacterium]MBT3883587.1 hypothetical protein [Rhodospirillaceae bacterium]MBT4117131.1 hypothetical protein [Rhodospirillaceae bacterium]MBT4672840.1 hypothetical protein [Rhodospirillaceae bacterium]MBT4722122.1 hypothetical protein [Rhodospirillaceae bacterium]